MGLPSGCLSGPGAAVRSPLAPSHVGTLDWPPHTMFSHLAGGQGHPQTCCPEAWESSTVGTPQCSTRTLSHGTPKRQSLGRCSLWGGELQGPARPTVGGAQVCWTAGGLGGPAVTWHFQENEKHLVITARATAVQSRRKTPLAPRWKYEPFNVFSEKLYFNNI